MIWHQPVPGPDGVFALTEMKHPCVNGCSGWFQLPAAERGSIVDPDADDLTAGNVATVNLQHRTDWSRPVVAPDDLRRPSI